jgi:hypothetical protein
MRHFLFGSLARSVDVYRGEAAMLFRPVSSVAFDDLELADKLGLVVFGKSGEVLSPPLQPFSPFHPSCVIIGEPLPATPPFALSLNCSSHRSIDLQPHPPFPTTRSIISKCTALRCVFFPLE